jgi:hypothetical protein
MKILDIYVLQYNVFRYTEKNLQASGKVINSLQNLSKFFVFVFVY